MTTALPKRVRAAGFTLFELVLVIVLVAVLSGILLGRFLMYQEMAEKTAMEQTAGAIRSALTIQVAGLIARGREQDILKLAAVNPVNFLAEKQKNYAGEFYEPAEADIPTGSWYFDLKSRQLVYLVHRGAHFVSGKDGRKWVRYHVTAVYNDPLPGETGKEAKRELGGLTLSEVESYKWDVK